MNTVKQRWYKFKKECLKEEDPINKAVELGFFVGMQEMAIILKDELKEEPRRKVIRKMRETEEELKRLGIVK